MPPLHHRKKDLLTTSNEGKAKILAEKLIPAPSEADLSDTTDAPAPTAILNIPLNVSPDLLECAINHLPNGKATGPDGIPNEALKLLVTLDLLKDLAQAVTSLLSLGAVPEAFNETTTAILRKERKDDYTLPGSYRPIALENSLAKLVEKVVVDRITSAVEEYNLLPWNQMGARKRRSTLSAIDLLTSCVQTAWKARPGCIVSMLSLDISGAFPSVSHERLLWVLRIKGFPP